MGKCISKQVPLDDVSAPEKRKSIDDEVPLRKSDRALLLLFNKEEDDTNGHLKGIPEEQEEQCPRQDLAQNAEKPTPTTVGTTLETIVESKSPDEEQAVEDKAEGQEEGAKAEDPIEVEKKELSSEKPVVDKHSIGTQCEIVKVDDGHAVQKAKESEAATIDKEERPSTPEISESKALLQEADTQLLQDLDTQLKESDAGTFEVELNAQDRDDAENRNTAKPIDLIKEDSEKFELIFKQISDKFEIAGIPDPYLGAREPETKAEDSTSDEPRDIFEITDRASVEPEAAVSGDLQHDEAPVEEINKASEIQEKTQEPEAAVEPEAVVSGDLQLGEAPVEEINKASEIQEKTEEHEAAVEPEAVVSRDLQHDEAPVEEINKASEIQEKTEEHEAAVEPEAAVSGDLQHDEAPVEEINKASEIQEKTEEHEAAVEPESDISTTDLQHPVQDEVPVEEDDNKDASCNMLKEPEQQPESIPVATAEDRCTSDEPREKTDGASEAVVIGELQHDEAPVEEIIKASEIQEKTDEHEAVVEPESATDLQHLVQDEVPVEENDNKDASCNMESKDEPEQQPESIVVVTAEDSSEPREVFEKTDGASVEPEAVVIGELQNDEAPVKEIDTSEIQEKPEELEAVVEPESAISATDLQHPVQDEVPVEKNDINKDVSGNMELKNEEEQQSESIVVATAEDSSTSDEPREISEKTDVEPEAVLSGELQASVEEIDKASEIQEKPEDREGLVEPESNISATDLQHPVQVEVPVEENDNKDASCNRELKDEPEQQPVAAAEDVVESTEAVVETPATEEAAESVEQHEHGDESAHQNISDEDHRSETTKASTEDTHAVQEEAEVQHAESQGNESSSELNALEEPAAANDTDGDHKLEDEKVSKEVSEPNAIEELAQAETRLETGEDNETLHAEPGAADRNGLEQHAESQAIQESSALEEPALAETNEDKKSDPEDESQVETQNMTSSSTDADGKSLENLEQKEDDTDSAQGTQHVGNEGADSTGEQITPGVDNPAGLSASEGDKRELHGEVPPAKDETTKTADIEPEDLVSETLKGIISNEAEEPTNLADKENVDNAEKDHPQEPETLKHAVIDEPDSAREKNIEDSSVVKELREVPRADAQPFAAPEHDQEQAIEDENPEAGESKGTEA